MSPTKQYLGDAVYADYDGYMIELTTENGIGATNRVYLEPEVVTAFLAYIRNIHSPVGLSEQEQEPHA